MGADTEIDGVICGSPTFNDEWDSGGGICARIIHTINVSGFDLVKSRFLGFGLGFG